MTIDSDHRGRLYEAYASTHAGIVPLERRRAALVHDIVQRLPQDRQSRILDIGCGQGDLLATLRDCGYLNAVGVDVSAEQVAIARRRDLAVEQADLLDFLAANPRTFDAITAIDVLEHFDKPELMRLMDAIAAALTEEGTVLAQVPNGESPFFGRHFYGDLTHATGFTSRSVRQLAAACGFDRVDVHPVEPVAHGVVSAGRRAAWRGFAALLKLVLAAETGEVRGHVVTQNLIFVARRRAGAGVAGTAG